MSEYLSLSGPGAVSLIIPESAPVNTSSVIRSSIELASIRILSAVPRLLLFNPYCSDYTAG